jgi:hypothetical protein
MSTNHRQPVAVRPGRTEERLYLNLGLSRKQHANSRHDHGKLALTAVSPAIKNRRRSVERARPAPVSYLRQTVRPASGTGIGLFPDCR